MATYAATKTKFLARMNRRDLTNDTTGLADGFLQDAITRIQRVIRVPAGEKSVQIAVDGGTYPTYMPIPNDYVMMKDFTHISGSSGFHTTLKRAPLELVQKSVDWGAVGICRIYQRQGSGFVVGPPPLAGDFLRLDYFSEYATVSNPNDDNILLDIANDLVLYGALSYAADHWSDKRGPQFEQRFTQILSDIQGQADEDELTGNASVAPSFQYPPDDTFPADLYGGGW